MSFDPQKDLQDKTLQFPLGLPGFPLDHRFVLTQTPQEAPFAWLTSLDTPDLAFVVVEPRFVLQEFTFDVNDAELEIIGAPTPIDTGLLLILRIEPASPPRLFANLRAPILVNLRTRQARQVILGDECGYSDSHPVGL